MGLLRKLFRAQPTPTADGAFSPSPLAIKMGTSPTTDYDGGAYATRYAGKKNRVLMVCTEQRNMPMANGKKFSTGNHPVEMGLPMLHLMNAGFEIDVVTPTGARVAIEEWAMQSRNGRCPLTTQIFRNCSATLRVRFRTRLALPSLSPTR